MESSAEPSLHLLLGVTLWIGVHRLRFEMVARDESGTRIPDPPRAYRGGTVVQEQALP